MRGRVAQVGTDIDPVEVGSDQPGQPFKGGRGEGAELVFAGQDHKLWPCPVDIGQRGLPEPFAKGLFARIGPRSAQPWVVVLHVIGEIGEDILMVGMLPRLGDKNAMTQQPGRIGPQYSLDRGRSRLSLTDMQQKAQRAALRLRGARPWAKAPNFPAKGDPYLSIREYGLWRYFQLDRIRRGSR